MNTGSLQSVLDCLDKPHACEKAPCGHKHESHCEFDLPEPIQHYIHKYSTLPWKAYEPGIQYCTLATACKKSRIQFFKFEPGVRSTSQNTTGEKITFIIDGIMHIDDRIYRRGDLIVIDDAISTQSIADKEQGYACLIVSAANNNKSWFRTILKLITQ